MAPSTQKIYAYVDESGQDTYGQLFVVAVLVTNQEKELLARSLLQLEVSSGKDRFKWTRAYPRARLRYVEGLLKISELHSNISVFQYRRSKEYLTLTALSTALAIEQYVDVEEYSASVFVDGLLGSDVRLLTKYLRRLGSKISKVRGVRKDENNEFIRLVDAMCGLIRDAKLYPEAAILLAHCRQKGLLKVREDVTI